MPEKEASYKIDLNKALKVFCLKVITFYRKQISPYKPQCCRFYPSCSQYTYEAIERFGVLNGMKLSAKRLLSCHPLNPGGYDPIPVVDNNSRRKSYD